MKRDCFLTYYFNQDFADFYATKPVVFIQNKALLRKIGVGCPTLDMSGPQPALAGRLGLGSHAALGIRQGSKVKRG